MKINICMNILGAKLNSFRLYLICFLVWILKNEKIKAGADKFAPANLILLIIIIDHDNPFFEIPLIHLNLLINQIL